MDGGYGETLTVGIADVIDFVPSGVRENTCIYHQLDLVDNVNLLFFLQLFQSQSQAGAASAKTFEHHPQVLVRVFCH